MTDRGPKRAAAWRRIPAPVWALGLTSLFMDMSSESIHSILPIFITQGRYTHAAVRGMTEKAEDRAEAVADLYRRAGGKLLAFYITFGEYDWLSIAEMLYGIRAITTSGAQFTWIPADFLQSQQVRGWRHMTVWTTSSAAPGLRLSVTGTVRSPTLSTSASRWKPASLPRVPPCCGKSTTTESWRLQLTAATMNS